ncbi:MAG: Rieske 2Fe-2S domain-containing protein [Chitinophagaceae bacterium]
MSEENFRWYQIASREAEISFSDDNLATIEVDGKKISLARFFGKLYAFSYKCPHASGVLAEGWLDGKGNIVCPIHKYRFDIVNGRNTSGEGYRLKFWPVETRTEGIFVGMEPGDFDLMM